MLKVAIALYVKDECTDIAGWLAWHFSLGVNTIFLFDDGSVDGTLNVVRSAASVFDIRLLATDPVTYVDHDKRHADCLQRASSIACEEGYDWIGFLDGDEYLYFAEAQSIQEFLKPFSDRQGVAINWCIYGSSGKVVKPRSPIVEVFTSHSDVSFPDNVLVKSFIRPKAFGEDYRNPHRFYSISSEHYVDPSGAVVDWVDATNPAVSWTHARVMHFICRSMEHYVARIKRRLNLDLYDSVSYWDHFNRNEIFDVEPLRFLAKTYQHFYAIQDACVEASISTLRDYYPSGKRIKTYDLRAKIYNIYTTFGSSLRWDKEHGRIIHEEGGPWLDDGGVVGLIFDNHPDYIHLVNERNADTSFPYMRIDFDLRISPVFSFKIESCGEGRCHLRSTSKHAYLLASADIVEGCRPIEARGRWADERSTFLLDRKTIMSINIGELLSHSQALDGTVDFESLRSFCMLNSKSIGKAYFLALVSMLGSSCRTRLEFETRGLLDVFY